MNAMHNFEGERGDNTHGKERNKRTLSPFNKRQGKIVTCGQVTRKGPVMRGTSDPFFFLFTVHWLEGTLNYILLGVGTWSANDEGKEDIGIDLLVAFVSACLFSAFSFFLLFVVFLLPAHQNLAPLSLSGGKHKSAPSSLIYESQSGGK